MIIDAHCHAYRYPDHWTKETADIYLHFLNDIAEFGPWWDPKRKWTYDDLTVREEWLVENMDRAGVSKAFLMGNVWKPYGCVVPMEFIAKILKKYPDRFIGFHVADPVGGLEAVEELERAVKEFGFKGMKLFPAYNYVSLDDKRMYPLWDKAQQLGIPVIVHTGWTEAKRARMAWQHPELLDDVAEDFPNLKISMGHTGFHRNEEALMVMPIHHIAHVLTFAKSLNLIGRLLWGTDPPFGGDPVETIKMFRRIPEYVQKTKMEPLLTDEDIDLILGENARKFIGI
jgi:predicted TIM-barrel fold metal-dependent hydrolase